MSYTPVDKQLRTLRLAVHAIALLTLLIGCGIYALAVLGPQIATRQEQAAQIERLKSMQQSAASARHAGRQLQDELTRIMQRQDELVRRIPQEPNEHDFLQRLSQAARDVELQIVDFQRLDVLARETHSELRLSCRCRGEYAAVCHLLHEIQNSQRLVALEHLQIDSDLAGPAQDMEMTIVLYFGLNTAPAEQENHDV